MILLTTADDFGWDDDTVATTIDLLERGVVRNASIMAGVAASDAALEYAATHPEHGWGVHLTLTRDEDEAPLLAAEQVPGLVDDRGRFLPGRQAQLAAALGRFPHDQLVAELTAQLRHVTEQGVDLDYVDSHKHLHKYPSVGRALDDVLPQFGLGTVRRPQDRFVGSWRRRPSAWAAPLLSRRLRNRWRSSDHFFMADGDPDIAWWDHVKPCAGSLEVGCHPGRQDAWRDNEREGIDRLVARFGRDGIEPRRWRDLRSTPSEA